MKSPTKIAVGDENGQVIVRFEHPVEWVALDPENARQIGEAIARAAHKAHTGRDFRKDKSAIAEQLRAKMLTRTTHVIRSLLEKGKKPGHIAAEVVDIILGEVL